MARTGRDFKQASPFTVRIMNRHTSSCRSGRHERIRIWQHPTSEQLGLYISIPFCRSKCTYCNFASGVYPASEHARYVQRLIDEMRSARKWSENLGADLPARVDTIYLGGGTPSLLEPELIAQLFAAIRAEFTVEPDAEITVECAPGQIADATLDCAWPRQASIASASAFSPSSIAKRSRAAACTAAPSCSTTSSACAPPESPT